MTAKRFSCRLYASSQALREIVSQRTAQHFVGDLLSRDVIGLILNRVLQLANLRFSRLRHSSQLSSYFAHHAQREVESLDSTNEFRGVLLGRSFGGARLRFWGAVAHEIRVVMRTIRKIH